MMPADYSLSRRIANSIRDIPDFPVPGVLFKDITPLLADPDLMREVIDELARGVSALQPDAVVGIESRGFLFAMPLALQLNLPFIPARKPGKLPYEKLRVDYELEYGQAALEMHRDALRPGQRAVIVDDLLATGGTSRAVCQLVRSLGAEVAGLCYIVELAFLQGRQALQGETIITLCSF